MQARVQATSCQASLCSPQGHHHQCSLQALPAVPRLCPASLLAPILRDVVAQGRNDGYKRSGRSDRQRRRDKARQRQEVEQGPMSTSGAWWEEEQEARPMQQHQQAQQYGRQQQRGGRGRRGADEDSEDESEQDTRGWWQKPEEASMQAYAPRQLSDWQVRRLEEAYALGRRKIKVQDLATELGLDRTEVLYWMKEFALRPDSERQAILQERKAALQQRQQQQRQEPAGPVQQQGWVLADEEDPARRAAAVAQANLPQHPQNQQGFIPFFTRKEMGLADVKHRRLSAEVLRTLESVYSRTPFPPDDVIRGMWDLHRVNRETVLAWLQARRQQDGIVSSEQKRPAAKDNLDAMSPAKLREAMGNVAFDSNNLLVQLAPSAAAAMAAEQPGQAQGEQAAQPVQVVAVSRRQLAQLKSSLPSPNKHKGRKRAEAMGVSTEGSALQVGAVQYVQEQAAVHQADKWRALWRHRRASKPVRTLPLLINTED